MKEKWKLPCFSRGNWHNIELKFTILTFLFTFSLFSSASDVNRFDLRLRNVTVLEVFKYIEDNSDYNLLFNEKWIDINKKIDLYVENETVENILDYVFEGTENTYYIFDNQIVITRNDQYKPPVSAPMEAEEILEGEDQQQKEITGTVVDAEGLPLPGVTVIFKGTSIGTVTNMDGEFTLRVPEAADILQVSFVGMQTQEIPIGNSSTFSVTMEEATIGLEEVVAVGYGIQRKESVVGSISQTTNEELQRSGNVTDLRQALTGQLPGVITVTSSGEPGGVGTSGQSSTAIYIRGQNTWNGGQPLVLVDGVERNMDALDVGEVESISVLKDASATAVFGVKGANGVILITTKRGKSGKPNISVTYNATAVGYSKLPDQMGSYDAIMMRNEAIERESPISETSWGDYVPYDLARRFRAPQTPEEAMIFPDVDWTKAMFKDFGLSHRAALNVQGGTRFVKYFGSLSYLKEGDIFKEYENSKGYEPNFEYDRFNFRSNFDFDITSTTRFSVDLAGFFSQKNTNLTVHNINTGTNRDIWQAVYGFPPDVFLPQYPDGRWGVSDRVPVENMQNPVALLYNTGIRQIRQTELNSNFELSQDLGFLIDGLSAKGSVFYDNSMISEGRLNDVTNHVRPEGGGNTPLKQVDWTRYTGPDQDPSEYITNLPTPGSNLFDWVVRPWNITQEAMQNGQTFRRLMYQLQVNYNQTFNLHSVGLLGLFKREEYARGSMFKNYREDWVFRATYDFDGRYLFEANGAYNGSEKFGPGYRFDFFPSVAMGWYVSNEKFFNVDWISRLKLRYSLGFVGDDNVGGRWLYASQYSFGGSGRLAQNPNNTSPYNWYQEATIGNPDIHWEKAKKNNLGVELGMFDNRIQANYDYFTEDRTNVLLGGGSRSIPSYFGGSPPSANLGHIQSWGHELEVKYDNLKRGRGFHYWATVAISHTQNEIIERDDPELLPDYRKSEGYPIGQKRTLVNGGFYNNWDEVYSSTPTETNDNQKMPGYYHLIDFNGDGLIKTTDDSPPYGYSDIPQNTYTSSLGFDVKGFSAMVQFYAVSNATRYIPLRNFNTYQNVVFGHVADHWSRDNQDASSYLPRWKTQAQNIGEYHYYDASFIRLRTAEIAYTFSGDMVNKVGLSSFRVYVNGYNLLFWSDLPDDRESSRSGEAGEQGAYPTSRRINLGFNLTF